MPRKTLASNSAHERDIELAESRDGYPSLAHWMVRDPDRETFIFRKFDRLAARNLHFLQCEIMDLEHRLDQYDETAQRSSDVDLRNSLKRWETFAQNAENPDRTEERERFELQREIQKKLRDYHEALLLQSRITALHGPSPRPLRCVANWLSGKHLAVQKSLVSGRAQRMFEDEQDLVALRTPTDNDPLSTFLQNHWTCRNVRNGIATYHERYVVWTVAIISTAAAAILLLGAIVSLYHTRTDVGRLGVLASFTVIFAASLALLTNAKRVEIFSSTAAYAAVLVVFVGSNLGTREQ